jgi:hypothetical protein
MPSAAKAEGINAKQIKNAEALLTNENTEKGLNS